MPMKYQPYTSLELKAMIVGAMLGAGMMAAVAEEWPTGEWMTLMGSEKSPVNVFFKQEDNGGIFMECENNWMKMQVTEPRANLRPGTKIDIVFESDKASTGAFPASSTGNAQDTAHGTATSPSTVLIEESHRLVSC